MLAFGDRIVAGVSGGADSICMLYILCQLRKEYLIDVIAVHVNHMLRGADADADEAYVKKICDEWGITSYYAFHKDIQSYAKEEKMTVEEAGRKFRYDCFAKVMEQEQANKIAVAHHQNDLAETVVFHMTRGSGIAGLKSILPVNGAIIRPLLLLTKKEIEGYLQEQGISYQEDVTNQDNHYTRNKIRNQVIPLLEEVNTQAVSHICQLAEYAKSYDDLLKEVVESKWHRLAECLGETVYRLSVKGLKQENELVQAELIRQVFIKTAGCKKDITRLHIMQIKSLLDMDVGKQIDLPYGCAAYRDYDFILIKKVPLQEKKPKDFMVQLKQTGHYQLPGGKGVIQVEEKIWTPEMEISTSPDVKMFDCDKIEGELYIRPPGAEDYIVIDSQGHKKKWNRYVIDCKIPKEERNQLLVIAENHCIMWIIGGRMGENYKITPKKTKTILQIKYIHKGE